MRTSRDVTFFAISLVSVAFAAVPSIAAPNYAIVALGFDDLEHTRNNGYRYSVADELNDLGQVRGHSERYDGGSASLGRSVWLYTDLATIDIGLTGPEHTRIDGYKSSASFKLNEAGQVIGVSGRFNGGSADLGTSSWLYDGAVTKEIGLTGAEHTRNDGYKSSLVQLLNGAGQAAGFSNRYNGGATSLGNSAWLFDGTSTVDVGLTDLEHTRADGYKQSTTRTLNDAGQLVGHSARFNGGTIDLGTSAWFFDGFTTTNIGLTGAEHTRSDGFRSSTAVRLNQLGIVAGNSARYDYDVANSATQRSALSAWLFNGAATVDIGPTGSEFTRSDGYIYSEARQLNEAGQVIGHAARYDGDASLGASAWLYNGASTIDIGLTGTNYTQSNGSRFSTALDLNEAGQVVGWSERYDTSDLFPSQSAWLYNGTSTLDIGLAGSEYTNAFGRSFSKPEKLNEAGQVIGYSHRFNGAAKLGRTGWIYNGATTIEIGLTAAEYTRDDGYRDGAPIELNEAGQVYGFASRFANGLGMGQDPWFYDPALDQTFALRLSTSTNGYSYAKAKYLGDDGLLLGTYTLYDGSHSLGDRTFWFTVADGAHDLGSLVEGGQSANGWDSLADIVRANRRRQILGQGKLNDPSGSEVAFLLSLISLAGDYSHNGVVDAADYNVWRDSLGQSGSGLAADGTGPEGMPDGIVDQLDYEFWKSHFGETSGSSAIANAAVPEPSPLLLLALGLGQMILHARNWRI